MKQGTTTTFKVKQFDLPDITEIIFSFTNDKNNVVVERTTPTTDDGQIHKSYPSEVSLEDGYYKIGLDQDETLSLNETFYVEAQIMFSGAVTKAYIDKVKMPHTFYTKVIDGATTNGEEIELAMELSDVIEIEGGSTGDYTDLTNKPRINNIELIGNKTTSDLGLDIEVDDGLQRVGNVISVKRKENGYILVTEDGLYIDVSGIAYNDLLRGNLTIGEGALASKSYVDDLMSGATKWEFVSQLPTEDIDIHTIYFVPKQSAETDNIYDEWVYAIQSRNPDVYDWELLGTSQVDLSNYYTKSETHALSYDSTYRQALTDTNYSNALQPRITSNNMLNSNLVNDSGSMTKLFVSATEKSTWNAKADTSDIPTNVSELNNDSGYQTSSDVASAISGKEDKTTISTDTSSTTVSLTLADNHEYRYTQDLTSLTLTMPSGDFISSIVFASGSTPTSMTYDSSIKWSGDDVTNGQFVPSADKDYDICLYYNGLNVNGIVRGAE